jgi:hypothetical protein
MQVFLSVGRVSTPAQQQVLERLEQKVRNAQLDPRTVGRNTFTSQQPLERVKTLMQECRGLIVLAFERTAVDGGREAQGLDNPPLQFSNRRYATAWHQIELAMASMLGLPTLVVTEDGLHEEGLLEDKYGWYVYRMKLRADSLDTDEFVGILADWARRCGEFKSKSIDPAGLTIGQIFTSLTVSQAWAVIAALAALVGGSFVAGAYFPKSTAFTAGPSKNISTPLPASSDVGHPLAEFSYEHLVGSVTCMGKLAKYSDHWTELNPKDTSCATDTTNFKESGSDDNYYYIWDPNRNMTDRVPKQGGDVYWSVGRIPPDQAAQQQWTSVYHATRTS